MEEAYYQHQQHQQAAHQEEAGAGEDHYPVEDLIPNSVRFGRDPQSLAHPLDPSIYGYDIAQMKERPWAKPGVDTSDYFNYGFDEDSWRAYCALQAQGIKSLRARADKFISDILASQNSGHTAHAPQGTSGGFSHTPNYASHTGPNPSYGNAHREGQREPREQSKFYKTQMCQGYLNGSCSRGAGCNYAHGQHELRQYVHPDRAPAGTSGGNMGHGLAGVMPPPVPVPTMSGAQPMLSGNIQLPPIPMPPMGMALPPPPLGMGHVPTPNVGGEGVLSAPSGFVSAPTAAQAPPQPSAPKGPAGFRILPQQKRDREKSPENVTY